ncbi:MAG: hypothetical protein F9B45_11725 [Phycisphaera sp. RhM]|nr:hypothetical protein [Phycisphaera sp. RhM]
MNALDDGAERALSGPENDGNANDFTSDKQRSERLRGAWNTPILIEVDGHDGLVAALPRRVTAFNPSTGDQLWTCGGAAPLAYASPIESDGVVVVLGGYGGASPSRHRNHLHSDGSPVWIGFLSGPGHSEP